MKCVCFSRNAPIFKFQYTGDGALLDPPYPLLFEVKFLFKNLNNLEFYSAINAYQEGTKVNIEVNVRVLKNLGTFILEYKAPLISIIGTNFLQPSALDSHYAGGNAAIYTVRLSVESPQLKNVRTMVTCATTKGTARW